MRLSQTAQFKRDIKRQIKKGKDSKKLSRILEVLLSGSQLPPRYKDHPLKGHWKGRRDCHVEPDWVLIYRISEDEIRLERTGSHSDLF
jgi:mRNA interferase YafQ